MEKKLIVFGKECAWDSEVEVYANDVDHPFGFNIEIIYEPHIHGWDHYYNNVTELHHHYNEDYKDSPEDGRTVFESYHHFTGKILSMEWLRSIIVTPATEMAMAIA